MVLKLSIRTREATRPYPGLGLEDSRSGRDESPTRPKGSSMVLKSSIRTREATRPYPGLGLEDSRSGRDESPTRPKGSAVI